MSVGLSQTTEKTLQLLRLLYHVNITVINDHQDLNAFSARHRFHPLQHMFSPDALRQLLRTLGETQVFLLSDAFMVRTALFYIDGIPVVLGPFSSVLLTARDIKALLHRFPIPEMTEDALLHYINSFPCISETEATHMIASFLQVLYPNEAAREIVNINYLEAPEFESEEKLLGKRENQTRLLNARYAYEQEFILNIMAGNARKALQEMRNMQIDVAYLKRIGTTLENERVGAAIVRTTARLAARQAGLPSVILDKISSDNTIAVLRAHSVEEISRAQELMVREFCKAVQTYKTEKHSALVQSAIYCIEKEYARDITVQWLADELDVSVNHLISAFKKETQLTPNVYLREFRLRNAARLLAGTDQSVQDIASSVGIPDANYMIKLFKAQYGETPTVYRKKYRV